LNTLFLKNVQSSVFETISILINLIVEGCDDESTINMLLLISENVIYDDPVIKRTSK
jgi:hypothetical protein